ncbi:MAG: PfkB family carbohydrate kinase [Candidatus Puniceispirillales bacterium]
MKAVLSIQSAVTFGAVGNTMANLVMAACGHHLSRVDTVQLAAHPGHGFRAGGSIDDAAFTALLEGLEKLGPAMPVAALMTGYIGRPGQIKPVARFITDFIPQNPHAPVIVDPAIGDHGRLYVDDGIARGIVRWLLPLATIITPNQFELGWLAEAEITSRDDAVTAAQHLLDRHPRMQAVILTGHVDGEMISDGLITREAGTFHEKQRSGQGFSGGGDLFSAIFTASLMSGMSLDAATERASRACHAILEESRKDGSGEILLDAVMAQLP